MERREYARINVNAKGTFIVKEEDRYVTEFVARIIDISEKGVRIEIPDNNNKEKAHLIGEDSIITFQAVEKFELFHKETCQFFTGEIKVVHKALTETGLILGCRLPALNESLKKYISDRKISLYLSTMGRG